MFIGKWNKSVIITYIGLCFSAVGIALCFKGVNTLWPLSCLLLAGICDMFDGKVARMCKRTDAEKQFGVELDSLVDVFNFVVFPIVILSSLGMTKFYDIIVYAIFGICGVARLANFNIEVEDTNTPVKHYKGLPVTSSAIIFPILYLLKFIVSFNVFKIVYICALLITAFLYIFNFKVHKFKGMKEYLLLTLGAAILIALYMILL